MPDDHTAFTASSAPAPAAAGADPADRAGAQPERCPFQPLILNWPDAVARVDPAGRLSFGNRRFAELAGRPAAALCGQPPAAVLAPLAAPDAGPPWAALLAALERARDTGTGSEHELDVASPGGRRSLNVRLVPDDSGGNAPFPVLIIARDTTERRETERALRARERDLAEAQRLAQLGNWRLDHRTGVLTWSDELYQIFGYEQPPRDSTFEAFLSRVHPDDRVRVAQVSVQARVDGQPFRMEYRIVLPDGQIRYVRDIGYAVVDGAGEVVGLFGTTQNITESKRTENALRELKRTEEQLQQAHRELARVGRATLLGELAASIAHEVNQPLAGVVTNADAALRWLRGPGANQEEAAAALRRIIRDGKRAADVVQRIRGLLNNGATVRTTFAIEELVRELVTFTHEEARRRDVAIRVRSAAPARITADRVQLQQVLLNLAMNSFDALDRVTDRAREVTIMIERPEPRCVQVSVVDNGPGLAPAQFVQVFDPFYTTKDQGIGMGLAISRTIVEAHGGRLWAAPNAGPGVRFVFALPAEEGAAS